MEYGADLNGVLTTLESRIASSNPSVPTTIYRKSWHNSSINVFNEVELCLEAYYGLVDDCAKESVEWVRKVEEEIGQNIAFLFVAFDESVRDTLVEKSHLFRRFDMEKQKFFK